MENKLSFIVRSTDIDVNGHVNNARYLEYLEWGRDQWYEENGMGYASFLKEGVQTVVVNISINYRKECFQGETLIVATRLASFGRSSYVFVQQITDENGVLRADAQVTSVVINVQTRKSQLVPQELKQKISEK